MRPKFTNGLPMIENFMFLEFGSRGHLDACFSLQHLAQGAHEGFPAFRIPHVEAEHHLQREFVP